MAGYATLIIRALATLEGVGLRASSSFSLKLLEAKSLHFIFPIGLSICFRSNKAFPFARLGSETFPYIARRLLTDDSLRIREAHAV